MACIDVPIQDRVDIECPPDILFDSIEYWRIFPFDPPQKSEAGERAICVAYDVAGNEKMRGDFWVEVSESEHFTLTPIIPAFPM